MKIEFAWFMVPDSETTDFIRKDRVKSKYAIKICCRQKYSLIYALSEVDHLAWINAFTKVTIRTDIHERFDVVEVIGTGSTTTHVFKAQEIQSKKWFAVKGFKKAIVASSEDGKLSLWKEIQMLRKVTGCPNLLNLYEVHETTKSIYLLWNT